MNYEIESSQAMQQLGGRFGAAVRGGEVFELVGDVGAGKTTLTKGLAEGLAITEPVQSPTFTISRVYEARDGLELRHYDFYRLGEAGIMTDELAEVFESSRTIVVVEWGGVVEGVLPADRLQLVITPTSEASRTVKVCALGPESEKVLEALR